MKLLRLLSVSLAAVAVLAAFSFAQPIKTTRLIVIGARISNSDIPPRLVGRLRADTAIPESFPGGTVLRSGDSSYWAQGKLTPVFAFQPDIIVLHLGINDSKPVNWSDSANFERDYKALIDTLASMPTKPRIIVAYPTPVWTNETPPQSPGLLRGSVIGGSMLAKIRKVAKDKGTDTVDLYTPFLERQSLFNDGFNPTAAALDTIARRIFIGFVEQSIRVLCIGNSITYAVNTNGTIPFKETYAARLNMQLGNRYWVWNGGKSGWWMQRATLPGSSTQYKSYITDKTQMDSIFQLKPHFITVKLGTNDARQNFWNTARFITDYRYFIDTIYNNMTPKPKFVLLKAIPAWRINGNWQFSNNGYTAAENGINGDIIRDSLGPAIDAIAASRPTQVTSVVDLYTAFLPYGPGSSQNLVTDGVHPNRVGQDTLSRILYRSLLPIVTSIHPGARQTPKAKVSMARTLHFNARPVTAPRGIRSLDGKATGSRQAAGVYVKPVTGSTAKKTGSK